MKDKLPDFMIPDYTVFFILLALSIISAIFTYLLYRRNKRINSEPLMPFIKTTRELPKLSNYTKV
jgi:hypothetical protein